MPVEDYNKSGFRKDLEKLINSYSLENVSDTPDFILAEYLDNCLANFNTMTRQREMWYLFDAGADTPESEKEEK